MVDIFSAGLGGISLIVVVIGLTQLLKDAFNLQGNTVRLVAVAVGVVVMLLYELQNVIADPYTQIYQIAFYSLAFGLGTGGFIDTVRSNRETPVNVNIDTFDDKVG